MNPAPSENNSVLIYSDPHLGLNLAANTTPASRQRLRTALEAQVERIVGMPGLSCLCAGDFFHTYRNDEDVILRAYELAKKTDLILGGNHDVTNVAGRTGSLALLAELEGTRVTLPVFGQTVNDSFWAPSWEIDLIPHHTTQDLFEEALKVAASRQVAPSRFRLLMLHCNYDVQFASPETTLNLSARQAEDLLRTFDYILLGHEHNPKEDFDGRLIVLGNTHPTGFGDISDKRIVRLHDDGDVTFERVWSMAEGYYECGPSELGSVPASTQFLRIKGEIEPSQLHPFTKALRALWASSPSLFAARSEVKIAGGNRFAGVGKKGEMMDIKALVTAELEAQPELFALWQEITQ